MDVFSQFFHHDGMFSVGSKILPMKSNFLTWYFCQLGNKERLYYTVLHFSMLHCTALLSTKVDSGLFTVLNLFFLSDWNQRDLDGRGCLTITYNEKLCFILFSYFVSCDFNETAWRPMVARGGRGGEGGGDVYYFLNFMIQVNFFFQ